MGTVTPTPNDELTLLFICEPQLVLLREFVEVVIPPVRFTLGIQPALAIDTFTSLPKQHMMMRLVLDYYDNSSEALEKGARVDDLVKLPVREAIGRFKYTPENELKGEYDKIIGQMNQEIQECLAKKEDE